MKSGEGFCCRRVLFISNVAWDHLWQRHQALASEFARTDDVVYCEIPGVRHVGWRDLGRIVHRATKLIRGTSGGAAERESRPERLSILRPWVLPSSNRVFHAINRWLLGQFVRKHAAAFSGVDLIVTYTAARAALHLVAKVSHRRLVYDCTDNFAAIRGVPDCFLDDERRLLKQADLTLVPGEELAARHRARSRRLHVLPHGASIERFLPKDTAKKRPVGPVPTLVYYGHMHRQHFDFTLVDELARLRPQWRIILAGPVVTRWHFPPTVELPGALPHQQLRALLDEADVIILPYAINEYTQCVLPAKTYECLASGLPVVATPLPELKRLAGPFIAFASDACSFAAMVELGVSADGIGQREARIAEARRHTWAGCHQQFLSLLGELSGHKSSNTMARRD